MSLSLKTSKASFISDVEVFRVLPRWLFVRVATSDGHVGWGEGTLEGHTEAIEGALQELKERFLGWDADGIEDIWQVAYRAGFYRGGEVLMSALSGLDIALWDIKGKKLGVPIYQLLGGKVRNRVAVYGWIGGDKPSNVIEGAQHRKSQGFTHVKMNATESLGWLDSPSALEGTVERLKAAKSCGVDVGLDFHGRVHLPMAKQLAQALEPYHPLFIEEPLLPTQPLEIADLARSTSIPVALGERLYTRQDFRPYLEARAVSIVQPDVSHCGGISEMRRIASLAETYDVALAPHCPLGPIALAACIQVAIASPNFVIQEMSLQLHYNQGTGADLLTYLKDPSVFAVTEGHIQVNELPGLGIELDEKLIRETSEKLIKGGIAWRNNIWRGPDGTYREW